MPWSLDAQAAFPGSMAALGTDAAVWLDSGELLVLDPATGTERRRLPGGSTAMLALPGEPAGCWWRARAPCAPSAPTARSCGRPSSR